MRPSDRLSRGESMLIWAIWWRHSVNSSQTSLRAVSTDNLVRVKELLEQGADVDARDPLIVA
jgi:hypothetical protein